MYILYVYMYIFGTFWHILVISSPLPPFSNPGAAPLPAATCRSPLPPWPSWQPPHRCRGPADAAPGTSGGYAPGRLGGCSDGSGSKRPGDELFGNFVCQLVFRDSWGVTAIKYVLNCFDTCFLGPRPRIISWTITWDDCKLDCQREEETGVIFQSDPNKQGTTLCPDTRSFSKPETGRCPQQSERNIAQENFNLDFLRRWTSNNVYVIMFVVVGCFLACRTVKPKKS